MANGVTGGEVWLRICRIMDEMQVIGLASSENPVLDDMGMREMSRSEETERPLERVRGGVG